MCVLRVVAFWVRHPDLDRVQSSGWAIIGINNLHADNMWYIRPHPVRLRDLHAGNGSRRQRHYAATDLREWDRKRDGLVILGHVQRLPGEHVIGYGTLFE